MGYIFQQKKNKATIPASSVKYRKNQSIYQAQEFREAYFPNISTRNAD